MHRFNLEHTRLHNNDAIHNTNALIIDLGLEILSDNLNHHPTVIKQIHHYLKQVYRHRFPDMELQDIKTSYQFFNEVGGFNPYHAFRVAKHKTPCIWVRRLTPTGFNYQFSNTSLTLFVSPRVYPMGIRSLVMCAPGKLELHEYLIHGSALLKRIWAKRVIEDSKPIWMMQPQDIRTSIMNAVETLYTDVKIFYAKEGGLKPFEVFYVANNVIENILHLMTLLHVYNNITEFKCLKLRGQMLQEYTQLCYEKAINQKDAIDFAYCMVTIAGYWIEYMLKNEYQHLVKKLKGAV